MSGVSSAVIYLEGLWFEFRRLLFPAGVLFVTPSTCRIKESTCDPSVMFASYVVLLGGNKWIPNAGERPLGVLKRR